MINAPPNRETSFDLYPKLEVRGATVALRVPYILKARLYDVIKTQKLILDRRLFAFRHRSWLAF